MYRSTEYFSAAPLLGKVYLWTQIIQENVIGLHARKVYRCVYDYSAFLHEVATDSIVTTIEILRIYNT